MRTLRFVLIVAGLGFASTSSAQMFQTCPDETELRQGDLDGEPCVDPFGYSGQWLHLEEWLIDWERSPWLDPTAPRQNCVIVEETLVDEWLICLA